VFALVFVYFSGELFFFSFLKKYSGIFRIDIFCENYLLAFGNKNGKLE